MCDVPTENEIRMLKDRGHLQKWKAKHLMTMLYSGPKGGTQSKDERWMTQIRDLCFIKEFFSKLGLEHSETMLEKESGLLKAASNNLEVRRELSQIDKDTRNEPPELAAILHLYTKMSGGDYSMMKPAEEEDSLASRSEIIRRLRACSPMRKKGGGGGAFSKIKKKIRSAVKNVKSSKFKLRSSIWGNKTGGE